MSESPNIPTQVGPFIFERSIGSGAFSTVYDARYLKSQYMVAIKVINKSHFPPDKFERELSMLQSLDHPFVVSFFECLQDSENNYLVMEKIDNGSLLNKINRLGTFPEHVSRRYFCQLISALDYLHNDLKIAHRDIKLENIMLDRSDNIRLIDFGLGNIFRGENVVLQTACGSPAYAPPEMLTGKSYTTSADIWSAGVVLYALTFGRLPFEGNNIQKLVSKIVLEEPKYDISDNVSEDLLDLIKRLLTKDVKLRITIPEIMEHPWFKKYENAQYMNASYGPKIFPSHLDDPQNVCMDDFDVETLNEMKNDFDIELDQSFDDLKNKRFNDVTALYKIIQREKMVEELDKMPQRRHHARLPYGSKRSTLPMSLDKKLIANQMKMRTPPPKASPGNAPPCPLSISLKLTNKCSKNVRSQNSRQSQAMHAAAISLVARHNINMNFNQPGGLNTASNLKANPSINTVALDSGYNAPPPANSNAKTRARSNSNVDNFQRIKITKLPSL